jgi:hypothetical protein
MHPSATDRNEHVAHFIKKERKSSISALSIYSWK